MDLQSFPSEARKEWNDCLMAKTTLRLSSVQSASITEKQGYQFKFRLRELTSCLCSAAAWAVCFEGCVADLVQQTQEIIRSLNLNLSLEAWIEVKGQTEKKLFIVARVFNVSYFRLSRNAGSVLRGLLYMTSAGKWFGQERP